MAYGQVNAPGSAGVEITATKQLAQQALEAANNAGTTAEEAKTAAQNAVKWEQVETGLAEKQDKLTGTEGQVPLFNASGVLEAQDFPGFSGIGHSEIIYKTNASTSSTSASSGISYGSIPDWSIWEYVAILVSYPNDADKVDKALKCWLTEKGGVGGEITPLTMPGYLIVLLVRHNAAQNVNGFAVSDRLIPFNYNFSFAKGTGLQCETVDGSKLYKPSIILYGAK